MSDTRHVAGAMKQSNKAHKSRFRSKGQLADGSRGRVNSTSSLSGASVASSGASSRRSGNTLGREARREQAKQVRSNKRAAVALQKRALGQGASPPHVVVVAALQQPADAAEVAALLLRACSETKPQGNVKPLPFGQSFTAHAARLKKTMMIVAAPPETLALLELARVADTLVLVTRADELPSLQSETSLSCLRAQGVPTTSHLVVGLADIKGQKKRNEAKRVAAKMALDDFPDTKVHFLEKPSDTGTALWTLLSQKRRPVHFRGQRSHIYAEDVDWADGCLRATGFVFGPSFDVNALVHVPGVGARRIRRISVLPRGDAVLSVARAKAQEAEGDQEMAPASAAPLAVVTPDPEQQHSLETEVPFNPFEGEQTWPTEEEEQEAEAQARVRAMQQLKPKLRKVPKGWSAYQAAWILDEDAEEGEGDANDMSDTEMAPAAESDSDEDMDDDKAMTNANGGRRVRFADGAGDDAGDASGTAGGLLDSEDEYDVVEMNSAAAARAKSYDNEMDMEGEHHALKARADEDREFPDELDTPLDQPASVRFAKYRGLQSFRHSPWDPREELPQDYSRIFKFNNFTSTRHRILRDRDEMSDDPEYQKFLVQEGSYVTIEIEDVPEEAVRARDPNMPLLLWNLLEHENKMSVVHFTIKMQAEWQEPIKSKERLVFYTGIRTFSARPIFSQHRSGSKQKFERFFQPGDVTVASCIAPITFPPMPVLVFKETDAGLKFVASGTLLTVNPDRMMIKRIRLSGHPYQINKRSVVVRFMFFNAEDVHWFKPVEIVTKYGRRGHIRESLGTHGHMKCIFDRPIKANDTVLLNLYKRVYPKWSHEEYNLSSGALVAN